MAESLVNSLSEAIKLALQTSASPEDFERQCLTLLGIFIGHHLDNAQNGSPDSTIQNLISKLRSDLLSGITDNIP